MPMIKRALISVTDKSNVVSFAKALNEEFGVEIISTGGTAKLLRESQVCRSATSRKLPASPKCSMDASRPCIRRLPAESWRSARIRAHDGAARSPHPADRTGRSESLSVREGRGERRCDRCKTLIENIDIGGPTMIRSAAKNYQDVAIVVSPSDYDPSCRRCARMRAHAPALVRPAEPEPVRGIVPHRRADRPAPRGDDLAGHQPVRLVRGF